MSTIICGGEPTPQDLAEIERFAAFLRDAGPRGEGPINPQQSRAYRKHYPEHVVELTQRTQLAALRQMGKA